MNEELKVIIRAELAQFKKAMDEAVQGLKKVGREGEKTSKDIDGFTRNVNEQRQALTDLKKKYIDLAAAHGKESKAAKDAAEQIKKLSAEYKTNKNLAADLANSANSFDVSLGGEETSKNVDKTNESMGELQDTLQGIYTLNIWQFVGDAIGNWTKKTKDFGKEAKDQFNLAGAYFKQAWKELIRDTDTLTDLDAMGESVADSTKGALLSAKYGFKELAEAVGASFKAIGASIAASAAVIIADLVIIIGLTKNALTVAKQIKQMASEASKIGMTTDTYQEWGYVLQQVGIEADKLTDFIKTLTEEQNAVRDGSEDMIEAFERIGLSAEEVMGSSQEELFAKTVEGLQNVENAAERTSLAYKIFGEDAADLANILYLTNGETRSLINNYNSLGAAPTENLIHQSKVLTSSTTNLSYAWQGLKNTLAEWVIPAVITVVQWLTTAVAYVNAFLRGVFGLGSTSKKAAEGVEAVGKGTNNVTSGAQKATKAVKELLRYTMGFDELNIIPKQSSDSGSGSGSGAGAGGAGAYSGMGINPDLPIIEVPDLSKFEAFIQKYKGIIQGVATWSLIIIGVLMAVFGFMSGNIVLGIAGISVAGLGIGVGFGGGEDSHWAKLAEGIKKAVGGIVEWFKTYVAPGFQAFLDTLKPLWDAIVSTCLAAWDMIKAVWEKVAPWFNIIWERIKADFTMLWEVFKLIWEYIKTDAMVVATFIWEALKYAWEVIKATWNSAIAFFTMIWNTIKGIFSVVANVLRGNWQGAYDAIKGIVGGWINYFKSVWEGIKKIWSACKTFFVNVFSQAWTGVKNVFSSWGTFFSNLWNTIKNKFKNVGSAIGDAVSGAVKGTINSVFSLIETRINGFINMINGAISVINGIPGVNISKINTVSLPRLATGGITTGATIAMIGERGREAVLPLENNTDWMDRLADRIAARNSAPSKIVLQVNERELGYATLDSINGITRQTGVLQLVMP